jgi:hypothetical protein
MPRICANCVYVCRCSRVGEVWCVTRLCDVVLTSWVLCAWQVAQFVFTGATVARALGVQVG